MTSRLRRPRKSIFSRPEVLHVVVRDLGDHVALVVHPDREEVGDGAGGDDHAGGVHALVAHQALEGPGGVDDLAGDLVGLVGRRQLAARAHRVLQADADRALGHELGDAVHLPVGVPEHAAGVAHHGAGQQLAEGPDAGHGVAAVLLGHVAHHGVAARPRRSRCRCPGRLLRPGLRKRSKSRPWASGSRSVMRSAVRHERAGGRAAARAHGHAVLARPADVVPDDQEVAREAHLLDDVELEPQPLPGLGRRAAAVAPGHALAAQALELGGRRRALRHREARQARVAQAAARSPAQRSAISTRDRQGAQVVGQGARPSPRRT